eukprot:GILI01013542.1.p1 GENE.GILI01013542.1~~GILI01013542.1.p1  ORF type:complete len:509 (+),score=140.29 GILI01013542.1:58-1527(+)
MGTHQQESVPIFAAVSSYFAFGVIIVFGQFRDFIGALLGISKSVRKPEKGLAAIASEWDDFYTRRLFHRIREIFSRPVKSSPGAFIDVEERKKEDYWSNASRLVGTGKTTRCLNLGSYNYLGFADDWTNGPCSKPVFNTFEKLGLATCSPAMESGTTRAHAELEKVVADFVGKPAAMLYGMGFSTNSTTLPALAGKGTLLISDSLNHTSIVVGARTSGAKTKVFRHNDMKHLEDLIREAIAYGQPRTRRPWKKIVIVVEGIYSMEGEICHLAEIVAIKKKYKCYLYVDEAHSIGALGATGRGVCEHCGVDPADVDVLMGTFTKSFGAVGGYIASSRELVEYVKASSAGSMYATTMSPVCVEQIRTSIKVITGQDGTKIGQQKIKALKDNSNYFRQRMIDMGMDVYGQMDSPIIPVMVYCPAKLPLFSRECLKRNIAVVVVGFPATPLLMSRVRFCISAAHTRKDLEEACDHIAEVADLVRLKYRRRFMG